MILGVCHVSDLTEKGASTYEAATASRISCARAHKRGR